MQYTEFKEKKISRLGFGTMRLPMDAEGKIVQETVNQMMDYALSHLSLITHLTLPTKA